MPSIDVNVDGTIQLAPNGAGELVGIGTTVPSSKLHVVGDTLVTGVSTFSDDIKIPVDNKKLIFGVDEELSITHTGSNSDIMHVGTGRLRLLGNYFTIANAAGNQDYIRANLSSSVTLYHSGNAKIQTRSDGAAGS